MKYEKIIKFGLVNHQATVSGIPIIESYKVGDCSVYVTKDCRYLAIEPPLVTDAHKIYSDMMEQLYYSLEPLSKSDDPVKYIENHLWRQSEQLAATDITAKHFTGLRYYLVRDILGYGILDVLMKDENVEEITAERFDTTVGLVHRKHSELGILSSNICFGSENQMNSFIQRTVQKTGSSVTTAMPIMSTMTVDGDRLTVTYGSEVSLPGPTICIRKFTRQPLTIIDLFRLGTLNELIAAYFWMLIDAKSFGLLVGETGSGKTTIANALVSLSNPNWKVITIEETAELKIPHYRWLRLVTRSSPTITQSSFDIDLMDLIKTSLRMRPDFEIVGEVRGSEAQFLFQSAATGHGGLTTFHASSAESAVNRLSSDPINIKAGQLMLLWYVAHVTRLKDQERKSCRKIVSVKEVIQTGRSIIFQEVFSYDQKGHYSVQTVDDLLKNSRKVFDAAKILNVDAHADLQNRIQYLKRCRDADADRLLGIISEYYTQY